MEHAAGSDELQAAEALLELGDRLRGEGHDLDAEPCYLHAIGIFEKVLGTGHVRVADGLVQLADLNRFLNLDEEAIPLFQRALQILEGSLGPGHSRVADVLLKLGDVLNDSVDDNPLYFGQAEIAYQHALEILEKNLGASPTLVDARPDLLAVLYDLQGKYAEAESLHRWTLMLLMEDAGADPLHVASQTLRWGRFCGRRGRVEECQRALRQALEIAESALGPEHPALRPYLHALAKSCQVSWKGEAEALHLRALAINERGFGKDHPAVVKDLFALESFYLDLEREAESKTIRRRILAIIDRVGTSRRFWAVETLLRLRQRPALQLAEDADDLFHRAFAIAEQNERDDLAKAGMMFRFAQLCLCEGHLPEAESLFNRTRAITETAHGADHPLVASLLLGIGLNYYGRLDAEVQRYYDEALAILKRLPSIDDALVARELLAALGADEWVRCISRNIAAGIGPWSVGLPRPVEVELPPGPNVELFYQVLLPTLERGFGPDHLVVGEALLGLASYRVGRGELLESEPLFLRALSIAAKSHGRDLEVESLSGLAILYHVQKRYAEAAPLYRRWLARCEEHPDPQEFSLLTPLFNLARCCIDQGRRHDAEPLFRRALGILQALEASSGFNAYPEWYVNFYRLLGREADLEALVREELSRAEGLYGRDHARVESLAQHLAEICYRRGDLVEAERLYRRAIASCERNLGPDGGARLAPLLTGLGKVCVDQGMLADAQALLIQAIDILANARKRNAEENGWFLSALREYGFLLAMMNREAEARDVESRAAPVKAAVEAEHARRDREAIRDRLPLDWYP